MDSILTSTKSLLGITEECTDFDADIIIHINTVLGVLNQLGIGNKKGFVITDKTAVWNDFIGNDPRLQMVKSYVGLKVRLLFDPPLSSSAADAINRNIQELEWRILVTTDMPLV